MSIPTKHAATSIVAVAYLALSVAEGGHSATLVASLAIAIWWAVIVALVVRVWPRAGAPRAAVVAGACLAVLGGLALLSMSWAGDPGRAFTEAIRIAGYLGLFALVVAASSATGIRPWLNGLGIGITAVAVVALAVRFLPGAFGGAERDLVADLPAAQGRLSYPIDYWNGLAACMALGVTVLLWLAAEARSRAGRAIACAALPLPVLAIYLSSSRGGFAAAALGVAVLVALGPARVALLASASLAGGVATVLILLASARPDMLDGLGTGAAEREGLEMAVAVVVATAVCGLLRYALDDRLAALRPPAVTWRILGWAAAAIALAVVVAANPVARVDEFFSTSESEAQAVFTGTEHLGSTEGSGRGEYWKAAIDAFASEPVAGVGAANWELYWNDNATIPRTVEDAHSLYLEKLAELGPAGALLVIAFLISGFFAARRRRTWFGNGEAAALAAVVAVGALSAALEWTWEIPAAFAPVVVAVALLTGPAGRLEPVGREARRVGPQFGLGVATIAVGWLSICAAGLALLTDVKLNDSQEAAARGDIGAAEQDAHDAGALQPWSPEPRLQLALVEERAGNLDAALEAAGEAIDRAPEDWRPWFVSARVWKLAGNQARARDALSTARDLVAEPSQLRIGSFPG